VLRNGRDVAVVDPRLTPANAIASVMVARDIKDLFPKRRVDIGEPILTVERLSSPGKFRSLSFSVRRGEIVGLTGLVGSGALDEIADQPVDFDLRADIYADRRLAGRDLARIRRSVGDRRRDSRPGDRRGGVAQCRLVCSF
jgi:ribose transport system ATP-binding protein